MNTIKFIVVCILLFLTFFVILHAFPTKVAYARTVPVEETYLDLAIKYQVDYNLMRSISSCESGGSMEAIGDGNRAFGEFQYHVGTWENFTKRMGENLDITSRYDQWKVTAWALSNGHGKHWTSYVAIQNGGTYSFYSKLLKKHFTVKCQLLKN